MQILGKSRHPRACFVGWAVVLAALAFAMPAFAQGAGVRETGRAFKDWQEACEPASRGEVCFIFQRLRFNGRSAANFTIGYKPGVRSAVAVINMPLGAILLPEGLRIVTDSGVEGWAPFRFCDQRGCHVETELDARLLGALRADVGANLIFRDLRGREIRLPVSLRGLTAGLESLRR